MVVFFFSALWGPSTVSLTFSLHVVNTHLIHVATSRHVIDQSRTLEKKCLTPEAYTKIGDMLLLMVPRGIVNFVSRESQRFPRRGRGKH